jgi:hypothetical protein
MTAVVLSEIFRRESRGLLYYVPEAMPWTPSEEKAACDQLALMIDKERKALAALVQLLQRRRIPLPYVGSLPDYTGVNFCTLDHLLRLLVEQERKNSAALEGDLGQLTDPEEMAVAGHLLEVKRRHVEELERILHTCSKHAEPVRGAS